MRRRIAAALTFVGLFGGCGGGKPAQWETQGFDTKEECWELHGWDSTDWDARNRKSYFNWWCG
ncbi:MAG: hypothetical protein OXH53_04210 [bacterium]|nr:hypothetical protein [bacterium]